MRIGIAGTGKMGSVIATRLSSLGHEVSVWNRTKARAQPLLDAGLRWADTPKALATGSNVVISLVTNEQALDDVYLSHDGLFAANSACVFIEMSTVRPGRRRWDCWLKRRQPPTLSAPWAAVSARQRMAS